MVFQLVFEKRAMWMWCALLCALLIGMQTADAAEKSASVRESQTEGNGVASRRLQASQHPDSSADRSLGVSVNQIGPDVSWGASADIPFSMGAAHSAILMRRFKAGIGSSVNPPWKWKCRSPVSMPASSRK